jgi:hypothetical protein
VSITRDRALSASTATGNSSQCISNYPAPTYRFILFVSGPIPSPLPTDYFVTHPATTQAICSDSNNPAWFFKRS